MVNSISGGSSDYLAYLLEQIGSSTSSSSTSSSAKGPMSATDMFSKLTDELGGDGKTITKSELENYIDKVESDTTGTYDKKELGFLKQLDSNWNNISGGSDSITESQLKDGMSYLKPPSNGNSSSPASDLFTSLLEAIGKDDNSDSSISKDDLMSYLKSLVSSFDSNPNTKTNDNSDDTSTSSTTSTSDADLAKEIKFITNIISNFDSFADSSGNMTSNSFYSALREPQDPSTITSDQLVSPIDIMI